MTSSTFRKSDKIQKSLTQKSYWRSCCQIKR